MPIRLPVAIPILVTFVTAVTGSGPNYLAATTPAAAESGAAPVALAGSVFTHAATEPITVTAVVWPDQETLDSLPVGASVPLLTVETVEAFGGRYTVRLDPAQVPSTHIDDGRVDIEVTATVGDAVTQRRVSSATDSYSESVTLNDDSWTRSPAAIGLIDQITRGHSVGHLSAAATAIPGSLVVSADAAATSGAPVPAATLRVPQRNRAMLGPICSVNKTSQTQTRRAKIGDVMPARNVTGRISYDIGSSHTLGIGFKSWDGSLSEGGTISRSSSERVAPGYVKRNHTARTTWKYRHYKNSCTQRKTARAESHQGGYYRPKRSHPNYSHCMSYPAGYWASDSTRAWTYQHGVTLWGALNVNAQSGYNEKVTLEYKLAKRHKLCGNDANPPHAELVAAK